MLIRPAKETEMDQVRELALKFDLDSEDMPYEEFLVAEGDQKLIGLVRIKDNKDCFELCSLGVLKEKQKLGIGKKLVEAVIEKQPDNLYLATIIPEYFAKFGFIKVDHSPKCMKKDPAWCEGCPAPEKCTVMKYEHS